MKPRSSRMRRSDDRRIDLEIKLAGGMIRLEIRRALRCCRSDGRRSSARPTWSSPIRRFVEASQ
jgi:hypothetical protein